MREQLKEFEKKMKSRIDNLTDEFTLIRAGRANPHILDKITVGYYGTLTPLAQMASISVPDARSIVISPFDASVLSDIESAIIVADIGINPQNDGKTVRLSFPPLTEDRRVEIVKNVSKFGEESKVQIRNIRREANDFFKLKEKEKEVTEDELVALEKQVQELTDKFCTQADKLVSEKEKEITTV